MIWNSDNPTIAPRIKITDLLTMPGLDDRDLDITPMRDLAQSAELD